MEQHLLAMLGSIPANCGAVLLFALACYGAGRGLLRLLLPEHNGYDLLLALVSGGALFALLGLAAGPLLLRLPAWGVMLLPGLAALWGIQEIVCQGNPVPQLRREWECWSVFLLLGIWFFASAELLPYSWDEQTYQIAVPADWLQNGSIAPRADLPYSAFPMLPQFLLLWLFKTGGTGTARLLILGCFLLLFRETYSEIRAVSGRLTAGVLTLVFILSPLPGAMIREFYAEVFLALFMLAGLRLVRTGGLTVRGAVLVGLFAGGAAAVKLTGLGVSLAIGVLCLLNRPKGKTLLAAGLTAGLFALAFYLRPWIALGNPVYPFLGAWFGSNAAAVEACHRAMGETHYGPGRLYGAVLGWLFTGFHETLYDGIILGWAFPLLFLFAFGAGYVLFRRGTARAEIARYGAVTGILYCFWAVTSQQTRFLLPLVPPLLLLTAAGLRELPQMRRMSLAVLLLPAVVSVEPWAWKHGYYAWKFLPDVRREPCRFLKGATHEKGLVGIYRYLAEKTPPEAGVLLVIERRGLYCPRPYRHGTPAFQDWFDFQKYPDWQAELKRRGIRYLLIGASRKNPDVQDDFLAAEQAFCEAVYQGLRTGKIRQIPVSDGGNHLLLEIL